MSITHRVKRLLGVSLAGAMVLALMPAGIAAADGHEDGESDGVEACEGSEGLVEFNDSLGFFESEIECMAAFGITVGDADGNYNSTGTVTRQQMALFIARLASQALNGDIDSIPESEDDAFDDIADINPPEARDAINWLAALEITVGAEGGDSYNPSGDVTRQQMASFIARAHVALGVDFDGIEVDDERFTDVDADNVHLDNINLLAAAGVVEGTGDGTTYSPANSVTRGQMSAFIVRSIGVLDSQGLWNGQFVVEPDVESNQTFTVTPLDDAVLESRSTNTTRDFVVTGVPADAEVHIGLVATGNVTTSDDGVVSFAPSAAGPWAAGVGNTDAVITRVNGINRTNPTDLVVNVGPVEDANVTFRIDYQGDVIEDVIPVVWDDEDGNNRVSIDTDNLPTEPFGVGGATLWLPPEAPAGTALGGNVLEADTDANFFVLDDTFAAEAFTYFYDPAGDDFRYMNVFGQNPGVGQAISSAEFDTYLTAERNAMAPADFIAGGSDYSTSAANEFEILVDLANPATDFEAEVGDFGGFGDAEDVQFTWGAADGSWLRNYVISLNQAPDHASTNIRGTQFCTGDDANDLPGDRDCDLLDDSTSLTIDNFDDGLYIATIQAQSHTGNVGVPVTIEFIVGDPPTDTAGPISTYAAITNDGGFPDEVDSGDEYTIVMYDAEGSDFVVDSDAILRVEDRNNEPLEIVRGGNSTWTVAEYGDGAIIEITMTERPLVDDDPVTPYDHDLTIVSSSGIADSAGNNYDVAASVLDGDVIIEADTDDPKITNVFADPTLGYQGDLYEVDFNTDAPGTYRVRIKPTGDPATSWATLGEFTTAQTAILPETIETPTQFAMPADGEYDLEVVLTDPSDNTGTDVSSPGLVVGEEGLFLTGSGTTIDTITTTGASGVVSGTALAELGVDSLDCTITDGDNDGQTCSLDVTSGQIGTSQSVTFDVDFDGPDFADESTVVIRVDMIDGGGNSYDANASINLDKAPVISNIAFDDNDGDSRITTGDVVTLSFDKAMDTFSPGNDQIDLTDAAGTTGIFDGPNSIFAQSWEATWTNTQTVELAVINDTSARVPAEITDTYTTFEGQNGFNLDLAGSVTTIPDVAGPVVTDITADATETQFTVEFNEPLDEASVTNASFSFVPDNGVGVITGTSVANAANSSTVTVTVSAPLDAADVVGVDADGVDDESGNTGPAAEARLVVGGAILISAAMDGDETTFGSTLGETLTLTFDAPLDESGSVATQSNRVHFDSGLNDRVCSTTSFECVISGNTITYTVGPDSTHGPQDYTGASVVDVDDLVDEWGQLVSVPAPVALTFP